MRFLVTGGAGYIGSHLAWALLDRGHDVVIIDDLSTGVGALIPNDATFVHGDCADPKCLRAAYGPEPIDGVFHFAGSVVVPESVSDPIKYYFNNTTKTLELLRFLLAQGTRHFVFSSTAAVYGQPVTDQVTEDTPTEPINPYGRSKLMIEWILRDVAAAQGLHYLALRYFNVAGADPQLRTGQATPEATHLIKVATGAALGARDGLTIFGTDFPTPDGTGVRDYIHVSDLADLHVLAMDDLLAGGTSGVLNCGYGRGFSVREVIDTLKDVSGSDFPVHDGPRRAGDPAALIADPSRTRERFSWSPRHDDLTEIVESALAWEKAWLARTANGA